MRRILLIQMTYIQTRKHQSTQMIVRVVKAAVTMMKKNPFEQSRSHLRRSVPSQITTGRLQQHNIVRIRAGPTSYFTSSIICGSPLSLFCIFFNEPTLRNILKCTISEAHRATGNNSWIVTLDELDKLIVRIVARGVIGGRTLPIKSIWDKSWGCPLFNATMPRLRFLKIIKFLRFDLKTEWRRNLEEEKFCLAYLLWNPFLKNFRRLTIPT